MNQVMNIYKNVRWQIFIFVVYMEKINWTIENDFQKNEFIISLRWLILLSNFAYRELKEKKKIETKKEDLSSQKYELLETD